MIRRVWSGEGGRGKYCEGNHVCYRIKKVIITTYTEYSDTTNIFLLQNDEDTVSEENLGSDDELLELLDQCRQGKIPSPFGDMEFIVKGPPASVQARKEERDRYIGSIKEMFRGLKYFLIGNILMDITWHIPAKSRYETDASVDIDNCIKPIIDAFTGVDGLFINDCQLDGLYICWMHIVSNDEQLHFRLRFSPDDYSAKDGIAFVRLDKGLCTPVDLNWPQNIKSLWRNLLEERQDIKNRIEEMGADYLYVAGLLGNSRPFHITRVQGFRIITLDEFASTNQS